MKYGWMMLMKTWRFERAALEVTERGRHEHWRCCGAAASAAVRQPSGEPHAPSYHCGQELHDAVAELGNRLGQQVVHVVRVLHIHTISTSGCAAHSTPRRSHSPISYTHLVLLTSCRPITPACKTALGTVEKLHLAEAVEDATDGRCVEEQHVGPHLQPQPQAGQKRHRRASLGTASSPIFLQLLPPARTSDASDFRWIVREARSAEVRLSNDLQARRAGSVHRVPSQVQ